MTKDLRITCLGIDCPERKSLCCGAISKPAPDYRFVCSKCGNEFVGGKCKANSLLT